MSSGTSDGSHKVIGLDPTSPLPAAGERPSSMVSRPATLDGAVVGLVANGLGETERFLRLVYDRLAADHDVAGVVPVLKHSVSVPPEPDDWARLTSEATVAITGFGG